MGCPSMSHAAAPAAADRVVGKLRVRWQIDAGKRTALAGGTSFLPRRAKSRASVSRRHLVAGVLLLFVISQPASQPAKNPEVSERDI